MFNLKPWQSNAALILVLSMGAGDTLLFQGRIREIGQAASGISHATRESSAQLVGQGSPTQPDVSLRIPAGVTLPTRYDDAEKIYVSPEEPDPIPVTLLIDRDIIAQSGALLIPMNSQVVGELRLVQEGSQFYAEELILPNGTRLPLDATSRVIDTRREIQQGTNIGTIITGAVWGAAAAAGIVAVTGDRSIGNENILGNNEFEDLIWFFLGSDRISLIAINPDTDLDITLTTPLALP